MPSTSASRRIAERLARALLLIVCAWIGAAHASSNADEADVAFQLGNRAFARADYEEALGQYFLSYRLAPNRNVLFNIARCYEALNRFNEAYRYYNDLASMGLAPEDRREVDASLERLRPKVALLTVVTEPPGADVFIEREDLGSRGHSPQTLALSPGKHFVRVKRDGYRPADATATVSRGHETVAKVRLEQILGVIAFEGGPAGAWIRESPDGPTLGTVPGSVALPPGRHLLYVGAPEHVTAQFLVDVTDAKNAPVKVALVESPKVGGKVVVTANRENALVKVDGKEAGFTPTVLALAEGEHELEVSYRDFEPYRQHLSVAKDQELKVEAELRYSPPPVRAAAKKLMSVDEAPASVTVITSEEIRAFGYTTLTEALAAVRGISTADDRVYSYLGIRGISPPGDYNTRVLILWDGHPMNDVWAGQGYLGRELVADLDEVDHIEIVRGPSSALYGTDALFAVINVVPRESISGHHLEATGAIGDLGAYGAHLAGSTSGSANETAIASASVYGAQGAGTTDLGPQGVVSGLDQERAYNGSGRARLGDFTLSAFVNSRAKDIPTAPYGTAPGVAGTRVVDTRGFVEARYDHDFANANNVSARVYYDASRYQGYWETPDSTVPSGISELTDGGGADWIGAEARYRFRLFSGNQLTLGTDEQLQLRVYQKIFGGPPLDSQARTLLSGYLIDEWQIHPRAFLSIGVRLDKYFDPTNPSPQLSPRAALIARPYTGGLTKLVAGEAFRAPNVYELYYQDNYQTERPALTLSPETITTFELEHSHDFNDELRITLAAYYNQIRNLIVLLPDPVGAPMQCGVPTGTAECIAYRNSPGVIAAAGAEAEIHWQPGRFAFADASYSYVSISVPSSADSSLAPAIASGTPVHLAKAKLMVPLVDPFVRLATQVTYQSARPVPGLNYVAGEALLVNVGLSGETEHFRYFAGVRNLLDDRYSLPVGQDYGVSVPVPQYGRTFWLQGSVAY